MIGLGAHALSWAACGRTLAPASYAAGPPTSSVITSPARPWLATARGMAVLSRQPMTATRLRRIKCAVAIAIPSIVAQIASDLTPACQTCKAKLYVRVLTRSLQAAASVRDLARLAGRLASGYAKGEDTQEVRRHQQHATRMPKAGNRKSGLNI